MSDIPDLRPYVEDGPCYWAFSFFPWSNGRRWFWLWHRAQDWRINPLARMEQPKSITMRVADEPKPKAHFRHMDGFWWCGQGRDAKLWLRCERGLMP